MNKKNDFSEALFFRSWFVHLPDLNGNSHGSIFNLHFVLLLFIKTGYFLAWIFGTRSELFCEGHLNVDVDMYEASWEVIVSLQMPCFL
jgi:hypothetical protein